MKNISILTAIIFFCFFNAKAQDKIKLKTGDIIKSRVLGITKTEVIYYKIFKLKDPKLKLPKGDVEYVQYENGKIVNMSGKSSTTSVSTKTTATPTKKKTTAKKKK